MNLTRADCQEAFISFWKKLIVFIIAIRTFIVRCMFILYASIAIWNVVIEKTSIYWLLLITIIPLFIETFIGIHQIKVNDSSKMTSSKWFSPVVALFLFSACPPIWIMEITICTNNVVSIAAINHSTSIPFIGTNLTQLMTNQRDKLNFTTKPPVSQFEVSKITTPSVNETTPWSEPPVPVEVIQGLGALNMTQLSNDSTSNSQENITEMITTADPISTSSVETSISTSETIEISTDSISTDRSPLDSVSGSSTSSATNSSLVIVHENVPNISLNTISDFKGVIEKQGAQVIKDIETMWSKYDIQSRVTILEQILLLNLILGRWILPRGGITRDQLSQLLLVNIGMSADILELFEAMKEPIVRHNFILNTIILILWQMSLIQFSLTKTVTKARKVRMGFNEDYASTTRSESKLQLTNCICCQTELWAIATSLLLQDIPFFCLRMTLICHFKVLSYSNIFFTSKNTLVILLQLFRSYVILCEAGQKDKELESAVSKQSLASIGVTRWNQMHNTSNHDLNSADKSRPLISDRYDLKRNGGDCHDKVEVLPKASPELSITSIGHSRSNSQMSTVKN